MILKKPYNFNYLIYIILKKSSLKMIFFCWRSSASNPSEKKYLSEISKDNTNVKVVATSLDENNVAYETAVK
jgi:hypothetical protein